MNRGGNVCIGQVCLSRSIWLGKGCIPCRKDRRYEGVEGKQNYQVQISLYNYSISSPTATAFPLVLIPTRYLLHIVRSISNLRYQMH